MADDSIMGNMPKSNEGTFGSEGFGRSADAADGLAFRGTPTPPATAEQRAYQRGQQDMLRKITTPRMTGWRVACGICWAFWTVAFGISAIVSLSQGGVGTFFLAGILAGLAGWYDYRIWTLKARRLTMFIIF
jgi:hypothetical protein